jgi:hypothetical protein
MRTAHGSSPGDKGALRAKLSSTPLPRRHPRESTHDAPIPLSAPKAGVELEEADG